MLLEGRGSLRSLPATPQAEVGKREGPVTLASATLGQASPSQEAPDSDSGDDAPPPPHLMVAVDLRKGSEGKRYHHFAALVDSGTT